MATRKKDETVDLYDVLKEEVFRQNVVGTMSGEIISALLDSSDIIYHPNELVEALTRLLIDGCIRLEYYNASGFGVKGYGIGFVRKLSDDDR